MAQRKELGEGGPAVGRSIPRSAAERQGDGAPGPLRVVEAVVAEGIATLTLHRPGALNALDEAAVDQLDRAFGEAVARPDVRAVVLQGAGEAFGAGIDLPFLIGQVEVGAVPRLVELARRGQRLLRRLETAPKPVIAKVDGPSRGAGTELALACQAVVATEQGSFGFPEAGLCPGLGGTQRTARMAGPALAKYLLFSGQPVDGAAARELGLATHYTDGAGADAFIRELVARGQFPDKYAPRPVPAGWEAVAEAFSAAHLAQVLAGSPPNDDPRVRAAAAAVARRSPRSVRALDDLIDRGSRLSLEDGLDLELAALEQGLAALEAGAGPRATGLEDRPGPGRPRRTPNRPPTTDH
ncbi:MAG: enoyl-CoA hydratase/isomerase family protein [Deferrisomatales bacterium]